MINKDADIELSLHKQAKNAIVNGIKSGKIKKPSTCHNCKKTNVLLEAHHHKGYAKENHTNVIWLCIACHHKVHSKNKDYMIMDNNVNRLDVMEDVENFMTESFTDTPEGYLTGRAIVTNIGVFVYKDRSGKIIRELRPPEEVLYPASINTLKMKPVTNNHPKKEMVDANNIKKYQVGTLGSNIWADSYVVSAPITITEQSTVNIVKSGKTALSCGYSATLDWTPGIWMGIPYDAVQRNIRYNHVSIVDAARAGDLTKIRLDSGEFILDEVVRQEDIPIENIPIIDKNKTERRKQMENNVDLRSVQLDGVAYQAEKEVIQGLNKVTKNLADVSAKLETSETSMKKLTSDHEKLTADRDVLKEQLDAANLELEELKKSTVKEDEIQAIIKTRIKLVDTAVKMEIEVKDEMSNEDIKKAVIIAIFPEANLDEKSIDYIDARFDAALEVAEKITNSENKKKVLMDKNTNQNKNLENKISYKSAREAYISDLENNNQGEK